MQRNRVSAAVDMQVKKRRLGNPAFATALFGAGLLIVGGAIFLGKSDAGQIDVSATIQQANKQHVDEGGNPVNQVNVESDRLRNMQNGGLEPQQTPPAAATPPNPETGTEPASTTPAATEATAEAQPANEKQNAGQ